MEYIEILKPKNAYFKLNALFYSNPQQNKDIFPGYFYNHQSIVIWKHNNRKYMYTTELVRHMALPNFDGIAFIGREDKAKLIICDPDARERFIISPPDFVQKQEYLNKGFHSDFFEYTTIFERFDNYFEYEGKKYLSIKIAKYSSTTEHSGISQLRYLDLEAREFLPFTKTIFTTTMDLDSGNPHAVPVDERIDL